jgi:branched-chain amino acid transport system substrate-binding protein
MKQKHIKTIFMAVAVVIVSLLFWTVYESHFHQDGGTVHIAVAGPMSGGMSAVGESFVRSASLCIDKVNQQGGIDGKKIVLDIFDDQGDEEIARKRAVEIATQKQAVAVIGHYYSSSSIAAGEIYEKYGIPAISPTSTSVGVTEKNPWYFRTVFNDNLQGRFLANYVKKVLQESRASIIYENHEYGYYLANIFEDVFSSMGGEIKYKWEFKPNDPDLDRNLRRIVYELYAKSDAGVIFLATHAPEGVRLVKLMRDTLVRNTVIAPDAFASKTFSRGFDAYPKEKRSPGYYTNGIYVSTPLLFDTANQEAHKFRETYKDRYQEEADWHAVFAYDTAAVILEAIKHTNITGKKAHSDSERKQIRDYLANLTDIDESLEGLTGLNYFNEKGDSPKPITIGVYKNRNIISALIQLHPVRNVSELSNFKEEMQNERVLLFDGRYMYKTNIVYTGLKFNEIREIDIKTGTCLLDFYIWFRYQDEIDVQDIEFLNAAEPLQLSGPLEERVKEQMNSRLYYVRGKFKMDFLSEQSGAYVFGHHILGFKFRHRHLTRNNLIYATDVLGMALTEELSVLDEMKKSEVFKNANTWTMYWPKFFQDVVEKYTLERLGNFDFQAKPLEYSQFNFGVLIKKNTYTLRGKLPDKFAYSVLLITGSGFFLILLAGKLGIIRNLSKRLWILLMILTPFLLLSAEAVLALKLTEQIELHYLKLMVRVFDILWWLIPAFLLNLATEPFLWIPMTKRTQQPVPNVLRRFVAYLIYFFAIYGIIVFVFDQDITKLMATSGMIAMVIGFIVKSNISDFFAGIMVNQEDAVRLGDRVKIGGFEEGKVTDITWRSTKLEVKDGSLLTIPNSSVLGAVVHNYDYPNKNYRSEITVLTEPLARPERGQKILLDAVLSVKEVLKDPEPVIRFSGQGDGAAAYSAAFTVKDYAKKDDYITLVWKRIWNHLEYAGIRLAKLPEVSELKSKERESLTPLALLEKTDIFAPFSDAAKSALSREMESRHILPGETLIREGDPGDSLFIIAEGVVGAWVQIEEGKSIEVARRGAGEIIGEMALLTGEKRTASIVSITETRVYEITRENIAPYMQEHPEIAECLSSILIERKRETKFQKDLHPCDMPDKETLYKNILNGIKSFFGLE